MNTVARIASGPEPADKGSLDLDALEAAPVARSPFPFLIVPGFLRAEARDPISADFPAIGHPGSFPLPSLEYGPAFASFVKELESPKLTRLVGEKLGLDLSSNPTMITVRGQSRAADGKIHTDSRTKLVTALIYMNDAWESPKGRLRLVRSADNLNDENLLLFRDAGQLAEEYRSVFLRLWERKQ